MTHSTLISLRLCNQQISGTVFQTPEQIVSFFCGMQAQDYAQAKWAIGLRLPDSSDADIEGAIAQKKIVRTWAMRGTLQFVAAKDYRWIHSLLAHRYQSAESSRNRQLGLDTKTFQRANKIIVSSLKNENILTRKEIGLLLNKSGIKTDQNRLSHILHYATMHQLICFGPRRGNEFSFVLLDDWIPSQKSLSHEKALAELTKRYFSSRGPATLKDFVWWTGLSQTEAKIGIEMIRSLLKSEVFDGQTYWLSNATPKTKKAGKGVHLLAGFDEYLIAYSDRSAALDPIIQPRAVYINGIFHPVIIIDGKVVGIWRPIKKGKSAVMRSELFVALTNDQKKNIEKEFTRYLSFLTDNRL